jgi:hypothetical protein
MKATLEFTLPEEQVEFDCAVDGVKWMSAMWELDQYLRNQLKYEAEQLSKDKLNAIKEFRIKLHEILNEEGLKL